MGETQSKTKHEKTKQSIVRAKTTLRRRMDMWLDANHGIYLRPKVLKTAHRKRNFKDNYIDHMLFCYNCGFRDKRITGYEYEGCQHNKVRDTFALADACMEASSYHFFSSDIVKIICSFLDVSNSTVVQIPICPMVADFESWNDDDPEMYVYTFATARSFFVHGPPKPRYRSGAYRRSRKQKRIKHISIKMDGDEIMKFSSQ